jgi:hypothetical protein
MFGRMAGADDDTPVVRAAQDLAIAQAAETLGSAWMCLPKLPKRTR